MLVPVVRCAPRARARGGPEQSYHTDDARGRREVPTRGGPHPPAPSPNAGRGGVARRGFLYLPGGRRGRAPLPVRALQERRDVPWESPPSPSMGRGERGG